MVERQEQGVRAAERVLARREGSEIARNAQATREAIGRIAASLGPGAEARADQAAS